MALIREFAPAKVNLTLEVAGRRSDGFHEIRSLVAFGSVGDWVGFEAGSRLQVDVSGPFGAALDGSNILDRALALLKARAPLLVLGSVHLEKHLPVAAGLGGGSADAAALLRAVRRVNGEISDPKFWQNIAEDLGADVPVCVESRSVWMTGIGHEMSEPAGQLPPLQAVLVNPMVRVPADKTAQVFRALAAGPVSAPHDWGAPPVLADRRALVDVMRVRGNDLSRAAEAVVPEIGAVLAALRSLAGIEHAAVSGAGPTGFGVFADGAAAEAGRVALLAQNPSWWVVATQLGSSVPLSP